jgi:hypothetical protein
VVLPVTNLTVRPEPWTGAGTIVTELFDGRRKLENVTWGYRIELTWSELRADQDDLRQAVEYLLQQEGADIYLSYDADGDVFEPTHVIPNCIPELSGQELSAVFERRARKRPGSLTLVSESQSLPLYNWITL